MIESIKKAFLRMIAPPLELDGLGEIQWAESGNHYVIKTVDRKPSILGYAGRLYSGPVIFAAHSVMPHEMHLSVNPFSAHLVIDFTFTDSRVAVKVTHRAAREIAKTYGVRVSELDSNGRPIVRNIEA